MPLFHLLLVSVSTAFRGIGGRSRSAFSSASVCASVKRAITSILSFTGSDGSVCEGTCSPHSAPKGTPYSLSPTGRKSAPRASEIRLRRIAVPASNPMHSSMGFIRFSPFRIIIFIRCDKIK